MAGRIETTYGNGLVKREGEARRAYGNYVKEAIGEGRRPELVGGGFIRSQGGWSAVKAMRGAGERELSDGRILGNGEFVEPIIKEAEAKIRYQLPVKKHHEKIDELIAKICKMKVYRNGSLRYKA